MGKRKRETIVNYAELEKINEDSDDSIVDSDNYLQPKEASRSYTSNWIICCLIFIFFLLFACLVFLITSLFVIRNLKSTFSDSTPSFAPSSAPSFVTSLPSNLPSLSPSITPNPNAEQQNQHSHWTSFNRYPYLYEQMVYKSMTLDNSHKLKILDYGCSTGQELAALATLYFKDENAYDFYCVDIDDPTLEEARKTAANHSVTATIFNGFDIPINTYKPYDLIFANSVLCENPIEPPTWEYLNEVYPFHTFESSIARLDAALRVGGYLAIFQSNYNILQTQIGKDRFELITECYYQYVPWADVEAKTVSTEYHGKRGCIYRKIK